MSNSSNINQKMKANIIFTIGLIAFFTIILILSFSLSKIAGGVPILISTIGIILSIVSLITDLKKINEKNGKDESKEKDVIEDSDQGMPFTKSLFFLILYLVGMVILGFYVSTFIILFILVKQLQYENTKVNFIFSFVTSSALFFTFKYVFYVRLPMGILFKLF